MRSFLKVVAIIIKDFSGFTPNTEVFKQEQSYFFLFGGWGAGNHISLGFLLLLLLVFVLY